MSKVDLRLPQIARLRVAGARDAVIASAVGLSPMGLARILSLPEYKLCEQQVLDTLVGKMDTALAGKADLLRQQFSVGVPMAMRALLDSVQQRRDLKASLEAAKELLDRDPDRTFSKQPSSASAQPTLSAELLAQLAPTADKVATSVAEAATHEEAAPSMPVENADNISPLPVTKSETVQ